MVSPTPPWLAMHERSQNVAAPRFASGPRFKGTLFLGVLLSARLCFAGEFANISITNAAAGTNDAKLRKALREAGYPSATACRSCHEQVYNEWRLSAHAYASISPMFHKFEQRINDLAQGTVGTFCLRCHASVGTAMGERRELPLWERSDVSREGITCITCHRINEEYGRVNGERRIVPDTIFGPMSGTSDGAGLQTVLTNKSYYKVRTSIQERGKDIHTCIYTFKPLAKSEFCVSCHQVAVHPGIKLE